MVDQGRFEMNGINKAIKIGRLSKRIQSVKFTGVFRTHYNISVRTII